jgi:hypothetical protein
LQYSSQAKERNMGISDFSAVLLASSEAPSIPSLRYNGDFVSHSNLNYLFSEEGLRYREVGEVILVPTYRLEEVEEIIEPEKPGVPVEPYVGLSWTCSLGYRRFVASVQGNKYEVIAEVDKGSVWSTVMPFLGEYNWDNYPRTPSTPAVSRKVKKWVKIDHPEVPE